MYDVFAAANSKGALGTTISGAGPTLIAYTIENGEEIGKAMVEALQNIILALNTLVLDIDDKRCYGNRINKIKPADIL